MIKFITDYLFVNNDDEILKTILNKLDSNKLTEITVRILKDGNIKVN